MRIILSLIICLSLATIPACTTTTNPDGSVTGEIDVDTLFSILNGALDIYLTLSALDDDDAPSEAEESQLETVLSLLDELEQRGLLERFLTAHPERVGVVKSVTG